MNKIILLGRLVKDVELISSKEGKSIGKFTLAINNGKGKKPDFIPVTVFGKTAENMVNFTKKGDKISVEGNIKQNDYEKDGVKHYGLQVIGNVVRFV